MELIYRVGKKGQEAAAALLHCRGKAIFLKHEKEENKNWKKKW